MPSRGSFFSAARALILCSFILFISASCASTIKLDRVGALSLDPAEHQPLAFLPLDDARGYPHSGELLSAAVEQALRKKHYQLADAAQIERAVLKLSPSRPPDADAVFLRKLGAESGARLILLGAILNFRSEKSFLGSGTVPVRDPQSTFSGAWVLPTYRHGGCRMRLLLRLFDPEKDAFVWMAEGHASGAAGEEASLARALAGALLEALPALPETPGPK